MTTQSEIEQRLLDFIGREVFHNQGQLSVDTNLVAAGFDSLSLVSVLLFVEREYEFWMPENEITAEVLTSIRSLASHVLKHLA